MSKGKAFFVVGHKNWGKSKTLRALTDGRLSQTWEIESILFVIKRMSNDDIDLTDFINELDPAVTPRVILALCPTFDDKELPVQDLLTPMRRKYELFFFVLRHKCNNPKSTIPDDEIDRLGRYGTVQVLGSEGDKPQVIAEAFKSFVKRHV